MNIAIIGSRNYKSLHKVREFIYDGIPQMRGITIYSGGAPGVDRTAAETARACGFRFVEIPADWKRYGKSAGMRRNCELIDQVDRVFAFWDGKSPGTAQAIAYARKRGIRVDVIKE